MNQGFGGRIRKSGSKAGNVEVEECSFCYLMDVRWKESDWSKMNLRPLTCGEVGDCVTINRACEILGEREEGFIILDILLLSLRNLVVT